MPVVVFSLIPLLLLAVVLLAPNPRRALPEPKAWLPTLDAFPAMLGFGLVATGLEAVLSWLLPERGLFSYRLSSAFWLWVLVGMFSGVTLAYVWTAGVGVSAETRTTFVRKFYFWQATLIAIVLGTINFLCADSYIELHRQQLRANDFWSLSEQRYASENFEHLEVPVYRTAPNGREQHRPHLLVHFSRGQTLDTFYLLGDQFEPLAQKIRKEWSGKTAEE